MSDYGITSAGLVLKRYETIKAEFEAFYKDAYGNPNLNSDSVIGRRIAAQTKLLTDLWELIGIIYNSGFIALTDEGSIDNVLSNEGATRLPALPTIIKVKCSFTGGTTITAGKLISNSAGFLFAAANDIVSAAGEDVTGNFICTATGPNPVPDDDTLSIIAPVDGWTGSVLSTDADAVTLGRDTETLAEARVRYKNSVGLAGAGTIQSLSANLNNIPGVRASILENYTDTTDVNGLPPHSISVIVQGNGSDAEKLLIANMMWEKRSGGIRNNGTTEVTIQDSNGDNQVMRFSYVSEVAVDIEVGYTLFSEETAPSNIHTAINEALVVLFDTFKPGQDILYGRVLGMLYQIPGIKSISLTLNGGTVDLSISIAEIAVLGDITFS